MATKKPFEYQAHFPLPCEFEFITLFRYLLNLLLSPESNLSLLFEAAAADWRPKETTASIARTLLMIHISLFDTQPMPSLN